MFRIIRWHFILILLVVGIVGTSGNSTDAQISSIATLREGFVGNVQRLNPLFADLNPVDADITSLIFEGLMRVNEYGEPIPALAAEMPTISFDGLEYVVRLRDDVLWQDGIQFNAADVIYTMSLLADPDFPGPSSLGEFWRTVETEQLGEFLVRFRLAQPLASFMEALRVGILPFHVLDGVDATFIGEHPFNLSPIGTGPFQIESIRSDSEGIRQIDLRKSPLYVHDEAISRVDFPIDRIQFQFFHSFGELEIALRDGAIDAYATNKRAERLALLSLDGDWQYFSSIQPNLGMVMFNWVRDEVGFFRDQRVRQALAIGVGRTASIERYLPNTAVRLDGPLPPGNWATRLPGFDTSYPWPESDPAIARDLLARASIRPAEDDPSGPLLQFSLLVLDDVALTGIANDLATQWRQYGVEVNVDSTDQAEYDMRLESGEFDAVIAEASLMGSADPDVYAFWHQGQFPDGLNYGGVNDTLISELLERARSDANGTNRQIHYAEFQQEFIGRAIAIPLYSPLFTYAVSSRVDGVQLGYMSSLTDRYLSLSDWQISP